TVDQNNGKLQVFLGAGDGTFVAQSAISIGVAPFAVTQGDLNGDGLSDLLAANAGDSTISILLSALTESATATGISVSPAGVHNVLASFPGDDFSRAASQSTTTPLNGLTVTTTTLTSNPSGSSVFGQSVTFTATVAPAPGSGPAFGTVT